MNDTLMKKLFFANQLARRITAINLVIIAALAGMIVTAGASVAASPTSVIEKFNQTLLSTMKNAQSLGYDGRYNKLAPEIKSAFNLPFMTQYSAGRYWRKLTPAQRDQLVDAFTQLTVATYANRFSGFKGEQFKILGEDTPRPDRPETKLVRTELITSKGEHIRLDYLMRETDKHWRIIDIFAKGSISELSTRRSEYSSALGNGGFDGLMGTFEQRIADLRGTSS